MRLPRLPKPFSFYKDGSDESAPLLGGTPAASPLGYYSWAFGQAARDPFYIMVVIYIFFPYFSSVVVGDPVRGQALIGYINASVGFVLAATILFLGAIADTVGRRKPWILAPYGTIALGIHYGGSSLEARACLYILVSV